MMLSFLYSLSPTMVTVSHLESPRAATSLPKVTKPIFLKGQVVFSSFICASMAERIHCILEMKVLFWFWRPGR